GWRDVVAVYTSASADVVLSFLALNRIGAIPALLNGNLHGEIAGEYIRRLRATGVLADSAHAALLAGQELGASILGDITEMGSADPESAPPAYVHDQTDPISITHSSGTTGLP